MLKKIHEGKMIENCDSVSVRFNALGCKQFLNFSLLIHFRDEWWFTQTELGSGDELQTKRLSDLIGFG